MSLAVYLEMVMTDVGAWKVWKGKEDRIKIKESLHFIAQQIHFDIDLDCI